MSQSTELAALLRTTIDRELPHLRALADDAASVQPNGPDSWSPKQELGHLIDSAANNHHRIVRASFEPKFYGQPYAQNDWVNVHGYRKMSWGTIIGFWFEYNTFLAALIARIPDNRLLTQCFIGDAAPVSLAFVIDDYVVHMQHHIDHLLGRPVITPYPRITAAQTV